MSRRTRPSRPARRGVMLLHMLIVLGMMGAFVVVADRVFRLAVLTTSAAVREQEDLQRQERALAVLRADVWQAGAVAAPSPSRVTLSDGVEWRVEPDGEVIRVAGQDLRRFGTLGYTFDWRSPHLTVSRDGKSVTLLEQAVPAGGER